VTGPWGSPDQGLHTRRSSSSWGPLPPTSNATNATTPHTACNAYQITLFTTRYGCGMA